MRRGDLKDALMVKIKRMKSVVLAVIFSLFGGAIFSQNLRTFTSNGWYGYKRGNSIAIPAKFSYAADFYNNRAAVLINNKWGYIDTTGRLVIPNDLDRAESFIRPYVHYYGIEGVGLMDTSGNKLTPAIFDEIVERYDGWYLNKGKMRGFYLSESGVYIEPKYVELDFSEQFIVCYTGSVYDVLNRAGKKLASGMTKQPLMTSYYQSSYCDVSHEDSTFIIDVEGRSVTQSYIGISPQETSISLMNEEASPDYYSRLFLLHLPAPENDFVYYGNEEPVSNRFHLFLNESHYYNDAVYSDYTYMDQQVLVKKDGVVNRIMDNGEFVRTKYIGKTYFNGFDLLYLPDSTVDIVNYNADHDTLPIAHFYRARIPFVERVNEYYNPEYSASEETIYEPTYLAVLEVLGDGINAGKFAVYDLWQRKFITPFGTQHLSVEELNNAVTKTGEERSLYVLKNETGSLAYSIDMVQSDFVFNSFERIYGRGILLKDELGRRVFVPYLTDTIIELPANTNVYENALFSYPMESYVDPETGNEFWNETSNEFTFDFLLLTDGSETPKYGFMTLDCRIVKFPEYDNIYGCSHYSMRNENYELIVTKQNELYGAYDLRRNKEIKPQYRQKLQFEFSGDLYFPYTQPDSLNYYLSSTGKKFHAQYNDGYPFKHKGKNGYISYNNFDPESETDTLIPAVYQYFETLYSIPYHIAGGKGKTGVLSLIGDTILPFEYDDVSWEEDYYSGYDQSNSWFFTVRNKKKGLFNAAFFKSIPAIYDDIEMQEFDLEDNATGFKVVSEDKCGYYDGMLTCIIPCEQDGIDLYADNNLLTAFIQKGNKVGAFIDPLLPFRFSDSTHWYDYVVGSVGYRKTAMGYDMYSIYTNENIGDTNLIGFPEQEYIDYEVFEKGGLLGIRSIESKKVLVKPTLRYIRMVDDSSYIKFENGISYYGLLYNKKAKYRMSQW